MPSKKYAISKPSAAIALRYGVNVSRGIGVMKKEIDVRGELIAEKDKEIARLNRVLAKGTR